jgi:hypothetical protein
MCASRYRIPRRAWRRRVTAAADVHDRRVVRGDMRIVLVASLVLAGLVAAPRAASADAIGAAEIADYYAALDQWDKDVLGPAQAAAVAFPGGAKRVYKNGAIFWAEELGATMIYGGFWKGYKRLGEEKAIVGLPLYEAGSYQQEFQNGYLYLGRDEKDAFSVTEPLLSKWSKNGWDTGPLGKALSDSVLVYKKKKVGTFWFVYLYSAEQEFEGGSISFGQWRPAFGFPEWQFVPDPARAAHVRVQMPTKLASGGKVCDVKLDEWTWAHASAGQDDHVWVEGDGSCGIGSHKIRPAAFFDVRRHGANLQVIEASTRFLTRTNQGYWFSNTVDIPGALEIEPEMEETFMLDQLVLAPDYPNDWMKPERLTIRYVPIQESDVSFE